MAGKNWRRVEIGDMHFFNGKGQELPGVTQLPCLDTMRLGVGIGVGLGSRLQRMQVVSVHRYQSALPYDLV